MAESAETELREPRSEIIQEGRRGLAPHGPGGGHFRGVVPPASRQNDGGFQSPRALSSSRISPRASPFAAGSPRTVAKGASPARAPPTAPGRIADRQLGAATALMGAARIEPRPRANSLPRLEHAMASPRYTGPCFEEGPADGDGHARPPGFRREATHDGNHGPHARPIRPPFEAGLPQGRQWQPDIFAADRRPIRPAQRSPPAEKARQVQCGMCSGVDDVCPDLEINPEHDLRQSLRPIDILAEEDGFSI